MEALCCSTTHCLAPRAPRTGSQTARGSRFFGAVRALKAPARAPRCAASLRSGVRTVAFKETEPQQDWRVTKMVEASHAFYGMWTDGKVDAAEELLHEKCKYNDKVWGDHLVVGHTALAKYIKELRSAYPDLRFRVNDIAVSDFNTIYVMWQASGTNLGPQDGNRASHHFSVVEGIDVLRFDELRTCIEEVVRFRQPRAEEKTQKVAHTDKNDDELHLVRLHFPN